MGFWEDLTNWGMNVSGGGQMLASATGATPEQLAALGAGGAEAPVPEQQAPPRGETPPQDPNVPWAPFGAYTPGMLSQMMSSWMPGQTASPFLPENPYAPWADTNWGDYATEHRIEDPSGLRSKGPGRAVPPDAGPMGRGGAGRRSTDTPGPGGSSLMGRRGAPGRGRMEAAVAGPAQPYNPNYLAEILLTNGRR